MKNVFDYVPEMAQSELYLEFKAKVGKKKVSIPAVKIADGVIATSELVDVTIGSANPALGEDAFQRIVNDQYEQRIMFLNHERQQLFVELHAEDPTSNMQCLDMITPMLGQELAHQEQVALLEEIKEIYGRKFPETSKESHGLNAWLKALNRSEERRVGKEC